ncbi:MAG: DUF4292 domain-containing protein, partial [Pyrinomonadaceae bacterium]|nr:DUF4292 domain-containing protein [Sphingobacteriaceae bacterium]
MKRVILTAICAAMVSAGAFAQTVDEVINKNITAMGG